MKFTTVFGAAVRWQQNMTNQSLDKHSPLRLYELFASMWPASSEWLAVDRHIDRAVRLERIPLRSPQP